METLDAMSFHKYFQSVVKECLSSILYSILIIRSDLELLDKELNN